jgi:hypothetical protein
MRQALRAEALGALGEVEAWLDPAHYDLIARYVAGLAAEWSELLETIRSRDSVAWKTTGRDKKDSDDGSGVALTSEVEGQ